MKIFFGIDKTTNPDNTIIDGDIFITQKIPSSHVKMSESLPDTSVSKMSLLQAIGPTIPALISAIFVALFYKLSVDRSLQSALKQYWLLLLLALFMMILSIIIHYRFKNSNLPKETDNLHDSSDTSQDEIRSFFNIPADAVEMDLLYSDYKIKNDQCILIGNGFSTFSNFVALAYREEDFLCLATKEEKYAIPLSQIDGIRAIQEQSSLMVWNKDIPYDKGEFEQYKLTASQWGGQIFFKSYYALCIRQDEEEYELYIPPYELPLLQRLTGIESIGVMGNGG